MAFPSTSDYEKLQLHSLIPRSVASCDSAVGTTLQVMRTEKIAQNSGLPAITFFTIRYLQG